jgi:Bacterial Ig-like domain (group 3)
MTRERVGLALLALVVGLVLVGGAAAGSAKQATPWALLSHGGSATRYLSSIGVNPKGVVVQRGRKNYAGPKCPGKGWTCTKSHRVLQFSTMSGTVNSVVCSASGGGGSVSSSSGSSAESCTIVQVSTSGGNNATCTEQATTTSAGTLTQSCSITQQSGSGKNTATVTQTSVQGPTSCSPPSGTSDLQSEGGTQTATVIQWSSSGGGTANVSQTATQCASTTTTGGVMQSQATSQNFTIQQGPPNFDPTHPVCTNTGSLGATASQSQHQRGYATTASGGTQNQHADLLGHIDQCSNSHADYTANQSEDQFLAKNTAVTQTQVGPTSISGTKPLIRAKRALLRGSCCSFQGTNNSDTCTITQNTSQVANPGASQTEQLTTTAGTSGSCTGTIAGTQNTTPFGSTQSGSNVDNTQTCQSGVCNGALIPTKLTWTGATSRDYHQTADLAATLTRSDNSAPISGQAVQLAMGAEGCLATTDANGVASCNPQPIVNDVPGTYPASGTFAATNTYAGSSTGSVTYTVKQAPTATALTYTGPASVDYDNHLTLTANLSEFDNPGTGVGGREVDFTITDGGTNTQTCTGQTTDMNGNVSCTIQHVTLLPLQNYTVAASFAGDTYYLPSSSTPAAFTVNKAPTKFVYSGATAGKYHDTGVVLGGTLTEVDTGLAVSGHSVTFALTPDPKSTQSCPQTTDGSGNASCLVTLTGDPGGYSVQGSFAGDQYFASSSTDATPFTISKAPVDLTYTGDVAEDWNDSTTLSATLIEDNTGNPVDPGKTVTFTITNGTNQQSCNGTTNASGAASCSFVLTLTPGTGYTVSASFAGDTDYENGSAGPLAYTVNHEESFLVYKGATSGDFSDQVTFKAVLTEDSANGTLLGSRLVKFTLGTQSCTGTTNSSGLAQCSLTINQTVGSATSVVTSFAGDAYYASSSVATPFAITQEEDNLSYNGPTSAKKGSIVTLKATLTHGVTGLSGRTITFTLGTQGCVGTTNSSGIATCTVTLNQNAGSYTVKASFAGDNMYEPDSASTSFSIRNS